ncbi:MAG: DUF3568 family protein [Planctomycetota bacterium]|jgi:hypothetical protein
MIFRAIAVPAVIALAVWGGCQGTTRQGTLYNVQVNRELESFLPADLATVHETAVVVIQDELGYRLERAALDGHAGIIEARTAQEHLVRVKTYKHGERITRIEVYVGPRGSEPAAREVLSKIEAGVQ